MFWSKMMTQESRELDKKLQEENPDLRSILDDIHCLQEIRNSHELLMDFLKSEVNFRQLVGAVLFPTEEAVESKEVKEKYRFVHQCCEALCIGAKQFYPELEKYEDLLQKMTTYLADNSAHLNPLLVSLYSRLVMTFLSTEPEKFLPVLENSNFLEGCMDGLENCALFELLCTVANCTPDPAYRERTKKWYVEKGFAQKMVELLSPSHSSAIHENVAQLWIEFVRALRDFQYNVEQSVDPLLESLQSEETIDALLKLMFPSDGSEFSPSIVANGAWILNVLLETNQIRNSPSQLLAQEMQSQGNNNSLLDPLLQQNFSFNSTDNTTSSTTNTTNNLQMDPKRVVETKCAEHASDILKCVIYSLESQNSTKTYLSQQEGSAESKSSHDVEAVNPKDVKANSIRLVDYDDSTGNESNSNANEVSNNNGEQEEEEFYGDMLNQCMQLLINLTNTNFLPTHFELLRAFSTPETEFAKLFEQVEADPSHSIFNVQLETVVLHILYSNTQSQRPLIDYVIKDFNLSFFILNALAELISHPNSTFDRSKDNIHCSSALPISNGLSSRLCAIAKQSFFLHMGKRLFQSTSTSPNAEYIEEMLKGLPNSEQWQMFCGNFIQSYIDQNRSEKVNSTTTRTSNAIEIDELPEDLSRHPMGQNLLVDLQEMRLEPIFQPSSATSPTQFSPSSSQEPQQQQQ